MMNIDTSRRLNQGIGLAKLSCAIILISILGCKDEDGRSGIPRFERFTPMFVSVPLDSTSVYAVVEMPAGTNAVMEMDTMGVLHPAHDPMIKFLPFPGNFGFVAGCGRRDSVSGVLTPLPVLVMMSALAPGSIIEVTPVAVLLLREVGSTGADRGSSNPIVIAVPADTSLQTVHVDDFVDFITEFDAARSILEQWFVNYQGRKMFGLPKWQDEHYTGQLIRDWKLKG
jgi:inorganic pyrophosphatase